MDWATHRRLVAVGQGGRSYVLCKRCAKKFKEEINSKLNKSSRARGMHITGTPWWNLVHIYGPVGASEKLTCEHCGAKNEQ